MSGIKKKIYDISSIGVTDIIASATAALFWLYIAAELGPESYGELTFLISIATIISGLALFGSNHTILVLGAKKTGIQSTIYVITGITNVIGSIIIFFIFFNIGISLLVIAYAIFQLVTWDLLARKLFKDYSKYMLTQKILLVVCGIGLYYLIGESGIIIGIALSHIPFILHIVKTFKKSKINFNLIREKKKFILNNFMLSISGTFQGSLDRLIIAPLLGFAILGNYSLGLQFFAILDLLPGICIKYLTTQDISGIPNKIFKKIIVLASICFAILGSTVGPIVLSYIFPKFLEAEIFIQIMSWAIIPTTIQAAYHFPKFLANEQNQMILYTTIVTMVIQIAGILILGSFYGLIGVAIAFLLTAISGTIFSTIIDKVFLKSVNKQ
jgi:O-antigen/teichoic acid export membrane protein